MDKQAATAELEFISGVMRRTHQRIDVHAFHYVHWGALVLVWYPVSNWFQQQGKLGWMAGIGIAAIVIGMTLSGVREALLSKRPRLPGENTFISRQVQLIVLGCIGAGMVLSAIGPATKVIDGPHVPIMWGFVYANLAFMVGVVYTREFLIAGAIIFVGAIVAMFLADYAGYILGPFMGLGLIVPGAMGERRVRRLIQADAG